MRRLYCIREKTFGAWVTSSKFRHLGYFADAAIFNQEKNAATAIRSINRSLGVSQTFLVYSKVPCFKDLEGYIKADEPLEFEVVPCDLTPTK
jgi:hypothetical protein